MVGCGRAVNVGVNEIVYTGNLNIVEVINEEARVYMYETVVMPPTHTRAVQTITS